MLPGDGYSYNLKCPGKVGKWILVINERKIIVSLVLLIAYNCIVFHLTELKYTNISSINNSHCSGTDRERRSFINLCLLNSAEIEQ